MRTLSHGLAAILLLVAIPSAALADTRAFVGAKIIPVDGNPIDNGALVVVDGQIDRVGARADVSIPDGAEIVELEAGTVIMPGIVDTHSHIGEVSGADRSGPIQPEARAMDAVNVRSSGIKRALAGGITSVNVMPGSGHLISGQTVYLKLRDGDAITDLAYRFEDGGIAGGLKMANGTNPMRKPPFPGTRAKSAALARAAYIKAQEYADKLDNAEEGEAPSRDLGMEALAEVLSGKRMVHFHSHRHDDLMTAMRLKDEFGFRMVLHHTSEAWRVADEIAAADVPVSLILIDSPGGKLEAKHLKAKSAPALEQAGADVALHTDDWVTDSRYFLRMAALAIRAGMSREAAIEALTIRGAEMLDMADRVGTLSPGKDADFVILSGDPFSVYTRVLETWVEGERRFDLDDEDDRLIAEGGFNALSDDDGNGHIHGHGHGDAE
ncbi:MULTISPECIES: amidohydrolase family protein [unclassified Wenzhouxiangella]|uniref:amidohydrolase family protein n=1 Tax=unclassified Wenzhouxiangella TaxID=2613841 RepID=UPI000E32717F|nr:MULTISPECIES: amidohydrolase family protein [unclassified Wenzhouxiangella]RFF27571.1 amidohydrolase [Wenzhouxiangella sp. 15181]RFP69675.1 amidohydrolase [Wenzhouxiangella sp. 15190]